MFTLRYVLRTGLQLLTKYSLYYSAQVGKFHSPYPTAREADSLHYTYLDTTGRPVVTIRNVGDLTEKHIEDFQVTEH